MKEKNYQTINYLRITVFSYYNFFLENISKKEFHFVKSVDMQLATNEWVIKNDRRLGSKSLLRSISLVWSIIETLNFFKEYYVKEKYSAGNL